MAFPQNRMRRLRSSSSMRRLVRQRSLAVNDFVYPLFVREGKGLKEPIKSMTDCFHFSPDTIANEAYPVRVGDVLGRMTITEIHPGEVVVTITEFGSERQEILRQRQERTP